MQIIDQFIHTLRQEISGERALDTVWSVARYNRIVGSTDYAAAVAYLHDKLVAAGVDDVVVESFPIDGQQTYTGRVFGPAWEPHSARLAVVAPESYVIADFDVTPMCLPSGCPATPVGGILAEVIDVGAGDREADYAECHVAGKAVLATGLTTDVYNLAVEQFGAACVLTTNMYDWSTLPAVKRTFLDLPDATHLARLYFDAEKRRPSPTFSITHRHAERLRALSRQGPVTVRATVVAESKPGALLEVVATIQGTDLAEQEVWLTAHLCHPKPGACDNASGVALGVELFRTIAVLIRQGALPRPRRTLRLLLLPEMSGTQAYMDRYQEHMDKVAAAINLDMVGASHTTGAYCRVLQTPWSRPSFLNHLAGYVLEQVSLGSHSHIRPEPVRDWLYALAPYDKGSDHDVTLQSSYAIPSLFFFYWPYRFYHTDLDTPEKLDAQEFARVGTVAGTLLLAAAALDSTLAATLLSLLAAEATRELQWVASDISSSGMASDTDAAAKACHLLALVEREKGALRSVLSALPVGEQRALAATVNTVETKLVQVINSGPALPALEDNPRACWIPHRLDPWPLNFGKLQKSIPDGHSALAAWRAAVVTFDDKAIAALNYVNGQRSVAHIACLVTGELGTFPIAVAASYFDLLAAAGVVANVAQE